MTIYFDNPAGRLHRVLKGLKEVEPNSMSVHAAWAKVLATSDTDMAVLSRRIVRVLQLPPIVVFEMQQIDDELFDRDFAMRWWDPVERAFANTLFSAAQIAQILDYDNATLASLENCSYLLHLHRREAMPTEDDLESVRQLISELEEMVAASDDIDLDLGDFLLKHARAMRVAVEDFSITGAQAMEDAVDEALGAAIRRGYRPDTNTEEAEDETESKAALRKFWALLTRVALVLSMSANLLALGQAAHSDLASHPHSPPAIENVINITDSPHSSQTPLGSGPADTGTEIGPADTGGH